MQEHGAFKPCCTDWWQLPGLWQCEMGPSIQPDVMSLSETEEQWNTISRTSGHSTGAAKNQESLMLTCINERGFTLFTCWICVSICGTQQPCLHLSQGHRPQAAAHYGTVFLWDCRLAYLRNWMGDDLELGSTLNYAKATLLTIVVYQGYCHIRDIRLRHMQ